MGEHVVRDSLDDPFWIPGDELSKEIPHEVGTSGLRDQRGDGSHGDSAVVHARRRERLLGEYADMLVE